MRYSTVLLDVGQTLIAPRRSFGAVYSRVYREMGLDFSPATLEAALQQTWHDLSRRIPVGVDRYGYFGGETAYWLRFSGEAFERTVGHAPDSAVGEEMLARLRAAFRRPEEWQLFPDVIPMLDELRGLGVRLGVVSNWDSRLPEVLEALDLKDRFDVLGVSHLEGMEKPDPRLFEIVLDRLGARPGDAVHVGDVPELDLVGCRAAGVDGVLVDRDGRLAGNHPALSDLSSLPDIAREGIPSTLRG
jgi:putative hydrolase of the HAD superfamily